MPALLLGWLLAAAPAQSDTALGVDCDLVVLGAAEATGYRAFAAELRAALAAPDPTALALLVAFPLRVNAADGSTVLLQNPRALQVRLAEVFPEAFRRRIAEDDDVFCNYQGVALAGGGLWVGRFERDGREVYRVEVVNSPVGAARPVDSPALVFTCDAARHRVVIDSAGPGRARYRSWNRPRSAAEAPDLVLQGEARMEGTGPCAHSTWSFEQAGILYEVQDLGCQEENVPEGARGVLDVRQEDSVKGRWWCY